MTLINLTQGPYDLSRGEKGILILTPLHNQESFVPSSQQPSSQQFPVIRKPNPHFYTSALGLAGGVGLIVSCVWSVLLPAIGSVGCMAFAYLIDKKMTLLHAKELPPTEAKSQDLFEQRMGGKADSGSLLDEPVNTGNLPSPILPIPNATNQIKPNLPPPPGSRGLLDVPVNTDNLSPSISSSPAREEEGQKTASTPRDPRADLLSSIRNPFNFPQIKRIIKENPEKYPSNLLLKELKTSYARALDISKYKYWKGYFKDKLDSFKKSFDIEDQEEGQINQSADMKDICEEASHLDSLLKNMHWIKSLLYVLSVREDLSDKARKHCSEKLENTDKHIEELQGRNKKKPEETNAEESSSSQIAKHPMQEILFKAFNEKFPLQQDSKSQNSKSNEIKTLEQKFQERNKAMHGDGTSDSSDTEGWTSDRD